MNITESIKRHEGFRSIPYKDTLGNWTIGYGTKLPITKEEAELLLRHRLENMTAELRTKVPFFDDLPETIQTVLLDMLYNLGINRLMTFKRMWEAVEKRDWQKMAEEMKDSLWYQQVGDRSKELVAAVERFDDDGVNVA